MTIRLQVPWRKCRSMEMNKRTITLALTIAILIVIVYKIFGPRTGPGYSDGSGNLQSKTSHIDPFVQIEFNNGYYGESNYQRHMENWLLVEKSIDDLVGRNITSSNYLDSLKIARFMLECYISDTYMQAFNLASKLSTDLYIAPPSTTTNPQLPLRFSTDFTTHSRKVVSEVIPMIAKNTQMGMPLRQMVVQLSEGVFSKDKCSNVDQITTDAIAQDDSSAFVLDPLVYAELSQCFQMQAVNHYQNDLSGQIKESVETFASQLKYVGLLGDEIKHTSTLRVFADSHFIASLMDSSRNLLYMEDIANSIAVLVFRDILPLGEGRKILANTNFPFSALLLDLIISEVSGQLESMESYNIPSLGEVAEIDNPILAPMLVIRLASYLEKTGHPIEASSFINSFWFHDANTFPPKTWWFNNYPKFLIESYALGRLDGGQLPLWVSAYYSISGSDKGLAAILELGKYYNMIVFPRTPAITTGSTN